MAVVIPNMVVLKETLRRVVNNCLEYDVAPEVQIMLAENAQKDVYDAYNPYYYDRSYSLTDGATETYDVEKSQNMSFAISVNHPWGKLIEYGHGVDGMYYSYPYNRDDTAYKFLNPRPFYRHTTEELKSGKYKELLAEALIKRGVNLK